MSTFQKTTKHPETGEWSLAWWIDDYFGRHEYGVSFICDNGPTIEGIINPDRVFDPNLHDMPTRDHAEGYKTKDSGERQEWESGFNRDTDEGKLRYDLIPHELLERLAGLYTRGAQKYDESNWIKAETEEEIRRFQQSAWRHWMQWLEGEEDEDHGIAVIWNIMAYEWHRKHKKDSSQYQRGDSPSGS